MAPVNKAVNRIFFSFKHRLNVTVISVFYPTCHFSETGFFLGMRPEKYSLDSSFNNNVRSNFFHFVPQRAIFFTIQKPFSILLCLHEINVVRLAKNFSAVVQTII
jgi:hypothetical protein